MPELINSRAQLIDDIADKIDEDQLVRACDDMNIRYSDFVGGHSVKITRILRHIEERDRLPELEAVFKYYNPTVSLAWLLDQLKAKLQAAPAMQPPGELPTLPPPTLPLRRPDEQRQTWSCDMTNLSGKIKELVIGKRGLVGYAVSCPPMTVRYGLDVFLENLCLQSRADLKWTDSCQVNGPGKLDAIIIDKIIEDITTLFGTLAQGTSVFYHLRLDETTITSDGVEEFWKRLDKTFKSEMGQYLKDLSNVFVIVMGSSPSKSFSKSVNIRWIGELKFRREHLVTWMYDVLWIKSDGFKDKQHWNDAIPGLWADRIVKYSLIGGELNIGRANQHLNTSLKFLEDSDDGASFVAKLTERFK